MYKAIVTKSLLDLKRLDHGIVILSSVLFGGLLGLLGPELTIYSLIAFLFLMVIWLLTGQLQWRPQKGELMLSKDQLRLKWMKNEELVVDLKELSPKYHLRYYRPLGFLPKKSYIHLMLEGGPLGPHEYFFFHDGEYNAKQWEKLELTEVAPLISLTTS